MPINTSELTAQQQITAIYVAYYDRAPDPAGLQFWTDQLQGGRSLDQIATDFSGAAETKAKFPFFDAPDVASADTFITSIYLNLFGRTPDADGAAFWSEQLESGSTPVGEIILAILEGAQDVEGGDDDLSTVTNKIDAGLDWAQSAIEAGIGLSNNPVAEEIDGQVVVNNQAAFESATSILDGIDGTEESVTAAKDATDAFIATGGGTGESVVLTTGIDNLEGTIGSDVFKAALTADAGTTTYNTGDEIDGGAGLDTFRITASDDNFEDNVVFLNDVEVVEVRNFAGTRLDLDPTQWSGVNEFVFTGEDDIDIGNGFSEFLGEGFSTVTFRDYATNGGEDVDIEVAASVFAGSDDALTVNLFNAGNASNNNRAELELQADTSGSLTQDAVIEHLTVNSAEGDNFFEFDDSEVLKTLTINGSADLLMDLGSEDALTSVDASAHTGDLEFENTFNLENDFVYTGSQGADVIDIDSGFSGGNTVTINTGTGDDDVEIDEQEDNTVNVDLGEGDDRLELNDAAVLADTFQAGDTYNGGAGTDRLVATTAALTAATAASTANVSNFEVLGVSDIFTGTLDISDTFDEFTDIVLENGHNGGTIAGLNSGTTLTSEAPGAGSLNLDLQNAATSTSDVLNLVLTNDGDTFFGAFDATDVETVNIEADDADDEDGTDVNHSAFIDGSGIETINITGDASALDLTGSFAPGLDVTTVDSTGFAGDLSISLAGNSNDVTVTLGAGDDVVTGGDGADTIDAGAGDDVINGSDGADALTGGAGADTFVYTAVSQSSGTNIDTIADFLSGEDKIDVSALGAGGSYLGEVSGTNAVNSAFTNAVMETIFDTSTNELIVDVDGNGTVGAGDLVVELTGVTELDGTNDFIFA